MPMWPPKNAGALLALAILLLPGPAICTETPDLPVAAEAAVPIQPQAQPMRVPVNSSPLHQTVASSEARSFLDSQSEMDRRRLLDKQERTFQLEVDGKYARALKAYCDTGYGDERCFRPEPVKPAAVVAPAPVPAAIPPETPSGAAAVKTHSAPEAKQLPSVEQISGFGDELSAILVFGNGHRLRVYAPGPNGPRSTLPDGEAVVSIRPGEVLVGRAGDGKRVPLLFHSYSPNFNGSE